LLLEQSSALLLWEGLVDVSVEIDWLEERECDAHMGDYVISEVNAQVRWDGVEDRMGC
jgi:hypothetical protein